MNPLALSAQAVADASGDITVTLPAPSLGTWWQAAVVVPTAPTGATLALYLAGGKELSWIGPQPSAAIVVLPGQVMKVEGAGFTAHQAVSVNVRGGWASGNAQGIAPAGPSSFAANTFTGKVTANISGPVTIETAPTKPVTTKFAAGTEVAVTGASASGQTAPTFAGRTVSAASTVTMSPTPTWTIAIPAPAATQHIELHAFAITSVTPTHAHDLTMASASGGPAFASFEPYGANYTFDFQGAALPAGAALWVKRKTYTYMLQINYAVRS